MSKVVIWIVATIAFFITYYFTARAIAYSFCNRNKTELGDWAFGGFIGLCCMCVAPLTMCIVGFYYIDKGYIKAIDTHRRKVARLEQEKREQLYKIQELERSLRIGVDQ